MKTTLAVLGALLVLTVAMTYPLALHFDTAIAGPAWDGFIHLYEMTWFKKAIFDLHVSPLFNPNVFYPFGYNLALSHITPSNTIVMMPLVILAGPVVGFNSAVFLSFVLSGLGAYLLTLRLTRNRWASLLAGVAFAFSPYRFHNLGAGWLPNLGTQWLPFALLYVDKLLVDRRRTLRNGALAGFFFALVCLSSWYHVYIAGLAIGVYVLLRGRPWRSRLFSRQVLGGLLSFAIVAVLLILPLAMPLIIYGSTERDIAWPLIRIDDASASLDDLFLPSTYHPLWGDLMRSRRAYVPALNVPGIVYLGLPALALAAYALRKRRLLPDRGRALGAMLVLGLAAGILTMGLTLHLNSERVYLPVPVAVEDVFSRGMLTLAGKLALNAGAYSPFRVDGAIPVPLPGLLVYLFAPFGSTLRVFNRFGMDSSLAIAVLAGMGAAALMLRTSPARRNVLGAVLAAVVVLDFAAAPLPYGLSDTRGQETDRWLAEQPGDFSVLHFPLARSLNGPSQYRAAIHGKKLSYGYGTFFPREWREQGDILGGFPSPESVALLRSWDVRYVFVGEGAYRAGLVDQAGDSWEGVQARLATTPGLRFVRTFDEVPPSLGDTLSPKLQQPLPIVPVVADRTHVYEVLPP